jgi:GNAT superfamily N-acetyltransferase
VLACIDPQDGVIGTVQLIVDQPENQPHRADVAKLLVHEKARRKGAAMALMEALEAEARARDISVLVLDTSTGSGAETFLPACRLAKGGEIPRYALMPDGAMTATSVFYKFL